jgi:D-psicose/D-tagatose/L-ribulose 3-epimerase
MKISLCNEVIREMEFEAQCRFCRSLGYDGVELAPFTIDEHPHLISSERRKQLRKTAESNDTAITGLHWLLISPQGLSITSKDAQVRQKTIEVMRGLVCLCADLGGRILVHGSPMQRMVLPGDTSDEVRKRAFECFSAVAELAEQAGLIYCLEPLAPQDTAFVNTIAEAVEMVRALGSPAFRTMIDCYAASHSEIASIPDLLRKWLPTGLLSHVHFNDRNRRGPGQGDTQFSPILATLADMNYQGVIGVEPFDYYPDGSASAARAIGYIRGILDTQRSAAP